jgi:hypothetical protein
MTILLLSMLPRQSVGIWYLKFKCENRSESPISSSFFTQSSELRWEIRPRDSGIARKSPLQPMPVSAPFPPMQKRYFFVRQLDGRDQSLKNDVVGLTSILTSFTPGTCSAKALRSSANCSATVGPAWVPTYTTRSRAFT